MTSNDKSHLLRSLSIREQGALFGQIIDRLLAGEVLDVRNLREEYPNIGDDVLEQIRAYQEMLPDDDDAPAISTLGDYSIVRQVGRGGMGIVYEAWQNSINRRVALKILPAGVAADAKTMARFVREAHVAGKLKHSNVVSVYGMGVEAQTPYYAMEFVEGETLADFLSDLRTCEPDAVRTREPNALASSPEQTPTTNGAEAREARASTSRNEQPITSLDSSYCSWMARAFVGVADGLQHAHDQGVVHRDIKPSNLMFEREPNAHTSGEKLRILDFGLARHDGDESLTMTGDIIGTVAYMSPEQARAESAKDTDHRTDIYSLGATLYESLTLQPPLKGRNTQETLSQIASAAPTPPRSINPNIPRDLETIVLHCLRKDPHDRYPDAMAVAFDLRKYLQGEAIVARPQSTIEKIAGQTWRLRRILAASALVGAVVLSLAIFSRSQLRAKQDLEWVQQSIPQMKQAIDSGRYIDAFELVKRVRQLAPDDETIRELSDPYIRRVSVTSEPPGAKVSICAYRNQPPSHMFQRERRALASGIDERNTDGKWLALGTTPFEVEAPFGEYRWRVDHPDCVPQQFVRFIHQYATVARNAEPFDFLLTPTTAANQGMLLLGGRNHPIRVGTHSRMNLPQFWMDQHEVSNKDYQEFVDQGGYQRPEFWQESSMLDDSSTRISLEEAINRFQDQTGHPSPAGWRDGRYPEGTGELPVTGISWFEANAYARFRRKSLPTVFHWRGELGHESAVAGPMHNIETNAVAPVGEYPAIAPNGLKDMIGNVKEWCFNARTDSQERFALGGCWRDPSYSFVHMPSFSPWRRSEEIGFRCIRHPNYDAVPELFAQVDARPSEAPKPPPISSAELKTLKQSLYEYGEIALEPQVMRLRETDRKVVEQITINTVYGKPTYERLDLLIFLPKGFKRPLQAVILGNGNRAASKEELNRFQERPFILDSGRAYVFVATYGHFRHHGKSVSDRKLGSPALTTERRVNQVRDVMRVVEYLKTRPDIEDQAMAYMGFSSGAKKTPMMLSVVKDLKVGVMVAGGATRAGADSVLPAGDPFNYAPDVRQPVLMLNGKNDVIYPLENQKLIFEHLGSEIKRHSIFPSGHGFELRPSLKPRFEREVVDWLNEHLGTPERL